MNELLNLSSSLSKNQISNVLQASVGPSYVSGKDFDGAVDCGHGVHSFYQGDSYWFSIFCRCGLISERSKKFCVSLKSATISLSVYLNWRLSQVYLMTRSLFWSSFVNMVNVNVQKYPGQVGMLIFLKYLSLKSSVWSVQFGQFCWCNALWSKLTRPCL